MSRGTTNFGPLTTSFTPPSACFTPIISIYDYESEYSQTGYGGAWGAACTAGDLGGAVGRPASTCFPEGYGEEWKSSTDISMGIFSPGLDCPRNWRTACSIEREEGVEGPTSNAPVSDMFDAIGVGQTAIGCCPEGYDCAASNGFLCVSTGSMREVVSGFTFSKNCNTELVSATINDTFNNRVMSVDRIVLVQGKASDGEVGDGEGGQGQGQGSGGGLSRGGLIAIAVTIPLVAILAGISLFFYFRRKKKTNAVARVGGSPTTMNHTGSGLELQGSQRMTETATPGHDWHKPELGTDSGTHERVLETHQHALPSEMYSRYDASRFELSPDSHAARVHEMPGNEVGPAELTASSKLHL